jgi:probable F420-dependent oxidoreductase
MSGVLWIPGVPVNGVVTDRPDAVTKWEHQIRRADGAPTLTVLLPNFGHYLAHLNLRQFVDLARIADDSGVDRVAVADHVVMGSNTDAYPWGDFALPPDQPWYEPLTLLSAMASCTTRVRLATSILIAPLRNPVVLAKTAATLDQLSAGRLDLGVGVGWQREEYDAAGLAWSDRWRLLSEALACCRELWGTQPASYSGEFTSFEEIYCVPVPQQAGGIPFWLGGGASPANLRRLAKWCDGWIPVPINGASLGDAVDVLRDGLPKVQKAWREHGRDPSGLQVTVALPLVKDPQRRWSDLRRSLDGVPDLVAAGATDISVPLQAFCRDLDRVPAFLDDLAGRFRELASGFQIGATR